MLVLGLDRGSASYRRRGCLRASSHRHAPAHGADHADNGSPVWRWRGHRSRADPPFMGEDLLHRGGDPADLRDRCGRHRKGAWVRSSMMRWRRDSVSRSVRRVVAKTGAADRRHLR